MCRWQSGYSYVSEAPNAINVELENLLATALPSSDNIELTTSFVEDHTALILVKFSLYCSVLERKVVFAHAIAISPSTEFMLKLMVRDGAIASCFYRKYSRKPSSFVSSLINKMAVLQKNEGKIILDGLKLTSSDVASVFEESVSETEPEITFGSRSDKASLLKHFQEDLEDKSRLNTFGNGTVSASDESISEEQPSRVSLSLEQPPNREVQVQLTSERWSRILPIFVALSLVLSLFTILLVFQVKNVVDRHEVGLARIKSEVQELKEASGWASASPDDDSPPEVELGGGNLGGGNGRSGGSQEQREPGAGDRTKTTQNHDLLGGGAPPPPDSPPETNDLAENTLPSNDNAGEARLGDRSRLRGIGQSASQSSRDSENNLFTKFVERADINTSDCEFVPIEGNLYKTAVDYYQREDKDFAQVAQNAQRVENQIEGKALLHFACIARTNNKKVDAGGNTEEHSFVIKHPDRIPRNTAICFPKFRKLEKCSQNLLSEPAI